MILYGRAWRVGDEVSADQILDPAYANRGDPALLAAHCLEQVAPEIAEQAREGDLLLAGMNFGAGPDADASALALQALGIAAVIAASADPSFVETAETYGLPVIVSPEAATLLPNRQVLRLDLAGGSIAVHQGELRLSLPPSAPALIERVRRAQLLAFTRRVAEGEGYTE